MQGGSSITQRVVIPLTTKNNNQYDLRNAFTLRLSVKGSGNIGGYWQGALDEEIHVNKTYRFYAFILATSMAIMYVLIHFTESCEIFPTQERQSFRKYIYKCKLKLVLACAQMLHISSIITIRGVY